MKGGEKGRLGIQTWVRIFGMLQVVGFRGTYHAVLGRPCYTKFMAVPNYTYLKLKMSGPNGVITVGPTYRHAFECDMECVEYAEALAESEALIADLESLSKEVPDVKRHAGNFEPAETVKSVPLDPSSDVGVLGLTAHPGLPLKVFLGVGRCRQL
jgi:hypothetical protein